MNTKKFWIDLADRAGSTIVQAYLAMAGTNALSWLHTSQLANLKVALTAGVLSVAKVLAVSLKASKNPDAVLLGDALGAVAAGSTPAGLPTTPAAPTA